jgi:hypothetical protein
LAQGDWKVVGVLFDDMDPTAEELRAIGESGTPVQELIAWTGMATEVLAALRLSAGDFTLIRQSFMMPLDAWTVALQQARVSPETDNRILSALELGQAGSLRRAARLMVGLPAAEVPVPA